MSKTVSFLLGVNGAGKTTLYQAFGDKFGYVIDPDRIARNMNPDNPRQADIPAAKQAVAEFYNLLQGDQNFGVESTEIPLKKMEKVKNQEDMVAVYGVGLNDVQMNIDRVAARVAQGGHHIDEEVIRRRHGKFLKNLAAALELADQAVIIDNSKEPRVVATFVQGKVEHIDGKEPIPNWVREYALEPLANKHRKEISNQENTKPAIKNISQHHDRDDFDLIT